eukprot:12626387-Prorocentrum_lima.AAC.1
MRGARYPTVLCNAQTLCTLPPMQRSMHTLSLPEVVHGKVGGLAVAARTNSTTEFAPPTP